MSAASPILKVPSQRPARAFTLLELLVVIAIIGILTVIGLPAIRGMNKSNAISAASRQLLDDFTYARQRAIADHTTVYVVFVPPNVASVFPAGISDTNALTLETNIFATQFTGYALLSLRSVGDQPGQPTAKYLTPWRALPNGMFIATNKFYPAQYPNTNFSYYLNGAQSNYASFAYTNIFPFPFVTNAPTAYGLPYVAFDYLGRLVTGRDEFIPLAQGSVFYALTDTQGYDFNQSPDVLEIPPNNSSNQPNVIHIDWLTGKARVERQEVQ